MRTLEENYDILEKLLDDEKVFMNPAVTFADICGWLGARKSDMDALVMRELGLCGDELLARFRLSVPDRLRRKYGLNVSEDVFF